jgi:hypothetical protein
VGKPVSLAFEWTRIGIHEAPLSWAYFKTRTLIPFAWYCLGAGLFAVVISLLRPY